MASYKAVQGQILTKSTEMNAADKDFSKRSYINEIISIVITVQYIYSSSSSIPSAYITHSAAEVW